MNLLLDFGFAWLAVLFMVFLAVKYLVRKGAQKQWDYKAACGRWNLKLKKIHIPLGIALILVGLLHGLNSTQSVWSWNLGTLCWILSILLGLSYMFRKKLNPIKPWIVVHRVLTVGMVGVLVWHIVDVGGIQAPGLIASALQSKSTVVYSVTDTPESSSSAASSEAASAATAPEQSTAETDSAVPSDGTATGNDSVVSESAASTGNAEAANATATAGASSGTAATSSAAAGKQSGAAASATATADTKATVSIAPSATTAPATVAATAAPTAAATPAPTQTLAQYNDTLGDKVVLKDGTYQGVAQAFGPNLTVSVTIKSNRITQIQVVSHNERGEQFYGYPIQEIPPSIIAAQSLDVDTVSGATFTSVGIINAVNQALSQALVSGTLPAMKSLPAGGHGRH